MERRTPLGPRFGQQQRADGKVDSEEALLAWKLRPGRFPTEAAGDHQVEDQKQLPFQLDRDPLAEPVERRDPAALGRLERRGGRPKGERTGEPNGRDRVAEDVRPQRMQVQEDVRELGHLLSFCIGQRAIGIDRLSR